MFIFLFLQISSKSKKSGEMIVQMDDLHLLIVDDEKICQERIKFMLEGISLGERVKLYHAYSVDDAFEQLYKNPQIKVMLLDKNIKTKDGENNGIDFITHFIQQSPDLQIIMLTGSKEKEDVVKAMRNGAFGFSYKAEKDDLICEQIIKAFSHAKRLERNQLPSQRGISLPGTSLAVKILRQQINAIAETNRPLLLLGETGTGKTTVAKMVHQIQNEKLKRSSRPFIALNLAAIPANMIEGELFGHAKGAYTDATSDRAGLLVQANGGTLFLDEIGEASLDIQKKLLKVLEEKEFYPLGSNKSVKVSFRLVCATNKNLEELVEKNLFREDLFMRINTFAVNIPGLDKRKEDIPAIVKSILPKCCEENNVYIQFEDIPSDFIEYIQNNKVKGNFRGIEHKVSQLLVYSPKDKQGIPDLKNWQRYILTSPVKSVSKKNQKEISISEIISRGFNLSDIAENGLEEVIDIIEAKLIKQAEKSELNREDTAKLFKVTVSKVYRMINKLKQKGLVDSQSENVKFKKFNFVADELTQKGLQ